MSTITDTAVQVAPVTKARGYWATVGRRLLRDKVSVACAIILIAIFVSALIAPWLHLADPYQGSMIRRLRFIGTPDIRSAPTNSAATCCPVLCSVAACPC